MLSIFSFTGLGFTIPNPPGLFSFHHMGSLDHTGLLLLHISWDGALYHIQPHAMGTPGLLNCMIWNTLSSFKFMHGGNEVSSTRYQEIKRLQRIKFASLNLFRSCDEYYADSKDPVSRSSRTFSYM
jgi:hypothetical protein